MRVLNGINLNEFQKCGEIMVAVKRNKFAMACKFCSQLFTQLQSFMRHLQLQHNDQLKFVKEMEVYAVEELMNQTMTSCIAAADAASDESCSSEEEDIKHWLKDLKEEDTKWLEDGVLTKGKHNGQAISKNVNDKSNALANMSILRALEDCDVSFNMLDSLNETKCVEEEEKETNEEDDDILNSTLLREIQNDWDDSDNAIEKAEVSSFKKQEKLIHKTKDMQEQNMSEFPMTKAKDKENLNKTKRCHETTNAKGLKKMLEGLDDLEDVDTLLENLEDSINMPETQLNNKKIFRNQTPKGYSNSIKNFLQKLKDLEIHELEEELTASSKQLELDLIKKNSKAKIEHNKEVVYLKKNKDKTQETSTTKQIPAKVLLPSVAQMIPKNTNTRSMFEMKLNELETLLDIEMPNNSKTNYQNMENCTKNVKDFPNISPQTADNGILNQKLKSRTDAENNVVQACSYNISFKHDLNEEFEFKLKSFDDSLQDMPQNRSQKTNKLINISTSINEMNATLNEDLNKALAEALGNDESNSHQENELDQSLKQELLNLLDQELNEKDIKQLSELLNLLDQELNKKDIKQLSENMGNIKSKLNHLQGIKDDVIMKDLQKWKETHLLSNNTICKDQVIHKTTPKTNKYESLNIDMTTDRQAIENTKIKYVKTNLKAKNKLNGKQNVIINAKETKEVMNNNQQEQNLTNMIRADHKVFKQQKEHQAAQQASLQSPQQIQTCNTLNENSNKQRKTQPIKNNKENCTTGLSNLNIKQEKLTPTTTTNFINTRRGERTPLKEEQMFLKQSPKTQENLKYVATKTSPQVGSKASHNNSIKAQENLSNTNANKTPRNVSKKSPKQNLKPSPKGQMKQENLNKTPTQEKNELNTQKTISPKTAATNKSSENIARQNKGIVNNTKPNLSIPLVTPQKIRSLAVKLPKFTPEKLLMQKVKPKQIALQTKVNSPESIPNNVFKLPEGTILTKIPTSVISNTNQRQQSNEIVETPIKSVYCKQNFSEASLEAVSKTNSETIQQDTLIAQCPTINKLKSETISSKPRQRTPSIDILPTTSIEIHKTPRNLDSKSYAVGRTARKKEVLQRMRHIKKQIFKTIEYSGGLGDTTITSLTKDVSKAQKVQIENIQTLPNLKKQMPTPLIKPTNNFKKPTDFSSPAQKNLKDKQNNSNKLLKNSNIITPSPTTTNINEKLIKKSLKRPATSPLLNDENPVKRPHKALTQPQSELEQKRLNSKNVRNKSPNKSSPKENNKSSQKEGKDNSLERTQLDLSDGAVDFLQRNLNANRLNVESILNEDLPIDDITPDNTSLESNAIDNKSEKQQKDTDNTNNNDLIDDLLQQVHNEQNTKNETSTKATEESPEKLQSNTGTVRDFSETQDIELLEKIGLKIIKQTDIEHNITLQELDAMFEKAKQFTDIYRCWPSIWSTTKYSSESTSNKTEMEINLKNMLNEINVALKIQLSISDLKRLVNLINFWYVDNVNSQLIEKKKLSETTNRFLQIFGYIPKTVRRFYYCEYCEEYSNTKHKYFSHRIKHTGALYPYTCQNCSVVGFKLLKALKTHESICKSKQEESNDIIIDFQCQLCEQSFYTSALLNEHNKVHLKTKYKCAKCELGFATAVDVKNHMAICNKSIKNIPKQYTPRPVKQNKVANSKT